jgi:hypothetical protein
MKIRKPAPPIFDTEEVHISETIVNPLPKIQPIDIQMEDSDDDSSSSFEEITLNPIVSGTSNVEDFWAFIAKIGWLDKPRLTQTIKNRVITNYSQLNSSNKEVFNKHIAYFKNKLNKVIKSKKLHDKFSRKLNYAENEYLLLHVIMRGRSFYETIIEDPSPIGYLIGKTAVDDEFVFGNIFK